MSTPGSPPHWLLMASGPNNPALVAFLFLCGPHNDLPVDKESFGRVAESVGDVEAPGVLVETVGDLHRLCTLGNFVIAFVNSRLTAFTQKEWATRHTDTTRTI